MDRVNSIMISLVITAAGLVADLGWGLNNFLRSKVSFNDVMKNKSFNMLLRYFKGDVHKLQDLTWAELIDRTNYKKAVDFVENIFASTAKSI